MTVCPIRVIKFGGSLLDTPAVERLPQWLQCQPAMSNVLVVGGGRQVETLRKNQRARGVDDVEAHWLSIQIMEQTAKQVQARLAAVGRDVGIVDSLNQIQDQPAELTIFLPERFLRHDNVNDDEPLPENWAVTSDSIAARVAAVLDAAELVLLKSTLPASNASLDELTRTGFVDAQFPIVAVTPTIRLVNARETNWPEQFVWGKTLRR